MYRMHASFVVHIYICRVGIINDHGHDGNNEIGLRHIQYGRVQRLSYLVLLPGWVPLSCLSGRYRQRIKVTLTHRRANHGSIQSRVASRFTVQLDLCVFQYQHV